MNLNSNLTRESVEKHWLEISEAADRTNEDIYKVIETRDAATSAMEIAGICEVFRLIVLRGNGEPLNDDNYKLRLETFLSTLSARRNNFRAKAKR